MPTKANSGTDLLLLAAEELVPYEHWLSWLKNVALECVTQAHLPVKVGRNYEAGDFWQVLLIHAFMGLSLDESSNRLNQLLWDAFNARRRHKARPREFAGDVKRQERKCPNGDQVRKYRNSLPAWLVRDLNRYVFKCQLLQALREGLVTPEIDILVDNTDEWYYGRDRYPANPFITRGHNGPGTSRKRKYLGVMLRSSTTYLFCGVDVIQKKHSNVPFIVDTLDWLAGLGFQVRHVLGDRWFPTHELLRELPKALKAAHLLDHLNADEPEGSQGSLPRAGPLADLLVSGPRLFHLARRGGLGPSRRGRRGSGDGPPCGRPDSRPRA